MYSNDKTQIRQGLTNYIGALVTASKNDSKTTRAVQQDVVATLIEESMKLAADENNVYDLYVLKPLLRATMLLLTQRAKEIEKLNLPQSKEVIQEYLRIVSSLKSIVDKIN